MSAAEIALAADGTSINAIKAHRERAGLGLKDAKALVDSAQRR